MLSTYGKREWGFILALGLLAIAPCLYFHYWLPAAALALATLSGLAFFRDPNRTIPTDRGVMVSPADGVISSIHQLDSFEPFSEPATCIRIFLSVLDVHVNRSPCHGLVQSVSHKPGRFLNALNPQSALVNESALVILVHPTHKTPVAAVKQIAGMIARRIVCAAHPGQTLQRGQRFGLIKFGSTTELYIPASSNPQVAVKTGQRVQGGATILAHIAHSSESTPPLSSATAANAPTHSAR